MKWLGYLKVASATTLNILLNAGTFGRYIWLEGRVCSGVFANWVKHFRYKPQRFFRPTTEREIVQRIGDSRSVRVFGSGHSFNTGVVSDHTLLSLDDYSGLVQKEPAKKQVAVSADALAAAWVGNLIAYTGLLPMPAVSSLMHGFERGSHLVLESNKAFNRTIYHLHQELEFTVPFEETFGACERFIELYEAMYRSSDLTSPLEHRAVPTSTNYR